MPSFSLDINWYSVRTEHSWRLLFYSYEVRILTKNLSAINTYHNDSFVLQIFINNRLAVCNEHPWRSWLHFIKNVFLKTTETESC